MWFGSLCTLDHNYFVSGFILQLLQLYINNITLSTPVPATAPRHCTVMYSTALRSEMFPAASRPHVTAGFTCAPLT
jgi:hypothetical protein